MASTKAKKTKTNGGKPVVLILAVVTVLAALTFVATRTPLLRDLFRPAKPVDVSALISFPESVRVGVVKMMLGGMPFDQIKFDAPTAAGYVSQPPTNLLFHPEGGKVAYVQSPAAMMADEKPADWTFNAHYEIASLGDTGPKGNDVVAFLRGVTPEACVAANALNTISVATCVAPDVKNGVPVFATDASAFGMTMDSAYVMPEQAIGTVAGQGSCTAAFTAKPQGCFYNVSQNQFVVYSVVLKR